MSGKKPVYVVHRGNDKKPTSLERVSRVVCTLRGVSGNFVRYRHSWRPVHNAKDLAHVLDQMELKAAGIINATTLEHLPFIDPWQDKSPGLYPEALR